MKIKLSLLTSDKILELSNGEVRVPDTYNYRYKIPKPILGGLFCEKIFGPEENYKCSCGQLNGKQYDGNTCRQCGVTVGSAQLRYKNMGHVEFPFPIIHPLARKAIFKLFGKFEELISEKLSIRQVIDDCGNFINKNGERIHLEYVKTFVQSNSCDSKLLPETILDIDFDKSREVNKIVDRIIKQGVNPHDYVLYRLPIIPPGYRPILELDTIQIMDEINIHYIKIIKRKLHLEHLKHYPTPKVIILWGRHLLQRAVDALMLYGDQHLGKRVRPIVDKLNSKEGRLRGNLLGKRVDYSGRSVMVVSPSIPTDTAELPIKMAYELFKPFIISRLYKVKKNYRKAKEDYNNKTVEAMNHLYEIVKTKRVLVNRQPTLHRYGLQSFKIKLHLGKTVKLSPPVFSAYNADCYTGDTEVHTLKYGSVRFDKLEKLYKKDKNIWVWSRDNDGKQVPSLAKDIRIVKYTKELIKITLDNNKTIKCTPDNYIMLKNGEYIKAKNLEPQMSLMPFYFEIGLFDNGGFLKKKNEKLLYDEQYNKYLPEYWLVFERLFNKKRKGQLHHIDLDHHNNNPNNLKLLSDSKHLKLHTILYNKSEKRITSVKKSKEVYKANYNTITSFNKSEKHKKQLIQFNKSEEIKHKQKLGRYSKIYSIMKVLNLPFSLEGLKKIFVNSSWKVMSSIAEKKYMNYANNNNYIEQATNFVKENNITINTKLKPRYGIPFVQPDKDSKRFEQVLKLIKDNKLEINEENFNKLRKGITYTDWKIYLNKLFNGNTKDIEYFYSRRNHKVIKIEKIVLDKEIPVYDMKIENYRNFAISSGIYVHNCDGDQVAVYIPLSEKALEECIKYMSPYSNIISSCNSQPVLSLTHEILIGLYVITKIKPVENPKQISSYEQMEYLHQAGIIDINEEILLRKKSTCFGRELLSKILGFEVTEGLTKNSIRKIINRCFDIYIPKEILPKLDRLKEIGYEQATLYGLSIGMDDIKVPRSKYERFEEVEKYCETLVNEVSNEKKVRTWYNTIRDLKDVALEELGEDNPLKIMLETGARVKANQIVQLVVAKGLISDWQGNILEPIKNSLAEGLTPIEFFTTVYGSRKSMADKKFITPKSGYLARKLVTATRDLYIVKKDCGTEKRIMINGTLKRSPIVCEAKGGICQKCYGVNPATRKRVRNGISAGVIASQSVSEPTTQLCLSGDTEILDINNKKIKIKNVKNLLSKGEDIFVFSISPVGIPEVSKVVDVFCQRKEKTKIKITLDNNEYFESTLDHPIMMRDGTYREAQYLKENDSLMPCSFNHRVKKIKIIELNKKENFYDITVDSKYHNFSLAAGCFVHNSMRSFHTSGAVTIKSSPLNVRSGIVGKSSIENINSNVSKIIVRGDETREYFVNINYCIINVENDQEVKVGDVLATYHKNLGQEDISGKLGVVEHYYEAKNKLPKSVISLDNGKIDLKINKEDDNLIDIFINNKLQGSADRFAIHYGAGDTVEKGVMLTYGEVHLKEVYEKLGLEITANLFVTRLFELYKEEGIHISTVHFEVIFRAMTEIIVDNNDNLNLRRNIESDKIKKVLFKGISQIGQIYPSWLKKICFGWTKKCLLDIAMKSQTSLDLPSERIVTGELIKHDSDI